MKLNDAVTRVMKRLDDEDGTVWSVELVKIYVKDGYDKFCRETKCLFDMHVIENVPQSGNWGNDLERYFAETTPGMSVTDEPLHFTEETERDARIGGLIGGSTEGPTPNTLQNKRTYINSSDPEAGPYANFNLLNKAATGRLPQNFVDVLRVTWDEWELLPEGAAELRQKDPQYEKREGGDPRHYSMDKEGLFTLRLVPPPRGDAVYPLVTAQWGTFTQTSDTTVTTVGTWGILVEVEGGFPAGGPWGTPSVIHPATKNTVVELARLGRPLEGYAFEIPDAHVKFVEFWAMSRAFTKNGVGQDLKLAKHFSDRYKMGVQRMDHRLKTHQREQVLKFGSGSSVQDPFQLGEPMLPYPYGPKGRIIHD